MALPLLLILATLTGPIVGSQQGTGPDDYVTRFERAMVAFDRGAFEEAAALFESAGRLEFRAPVWRVHAAVALLNLDRADEARALAVEAVRRGYPISDLRAIDATLVPTEPVPLDFAPDETAITLRLGVHAVPGWGDCTIGRGVAVVQERAWNLTTGQLEATQRERRVVAHRVLPDGTRESVIGPGPGRWEHVDGRVLDQPWDGREDDRAAVRHEHVKGFSMHAARRGLRSGLWIESARAAGAPHFLHGAHLAWVQSSEWFDDGQPAPLPVIDLATLQVEVVEVARLRSDSTVRDESPLLQVSEWLGAPLPQGDEVHRFEGVRELVVSRAKTDGYAGHLLVLDLSDGSVVAQSRVDLGGWLDFSIGPFVHVPEHELLLASNGSGSTLEAISTRTWEVVWREPPSLGSSRYRTITVRGDRVYSWATSPSHTDVNDIASGESILDGTTTTFTAVDGSDDGRWVAASSWGALHLLDTDDFEPFVELWIEGDQAAAPQVRAIGVDGTFDVSAEQIGGGQVLLVGGRFIRAAALAPWLWDPLHVRSLRDDDDRSARTVDARKIAFAGETTFEEADLAVIAANAPVVVALGRGGALRVLDAEDGEILAEAAGWRARGWALDVSPDGQVVALLTRDNEIYLWPWRDRARPRRIGRLEADAGWANSGFGGHISFSPTGERILVANDSSDRVLLERSGGVVARIPRIRVTIELEPTEDGFRAVHASGFIEAIDWSDDGSRLALVTEGRPAVYDARTGERLDLDLEPFEPTAMSIAFGPQGQSLATGHFRGKVALWDLETGKRLWVHEHVDPFWGKHDDAWNSMGIGDLAFSPDGDSIAMTSVTGIYGVLLDAEKGEQVWIGSSCGGRMGEPAEVTWSADGTVFYFAYVSGVMPVRRVELSESKAVKGREERRGDRLRYPQQFDLDRGSPVDIGWNGLAAGVSGDAVVVRQAVSGKVVWKR